jgi:hypothetical protein
MDRKRGPATKLAGNDDRASQQVSKSLTNGQAKTCSAVCPFGRRVRLKKLLEKIRDLLRGHADSLIRHSKCNPVRAIQALTCGIESDRGVFRNLQALLKRFIRIWRIRSGSLVIDPSALEYRASRVFRFVPARGWTVSITSSINSETEKFSKERVIFPDSIFEKSNRSEMI